MQHFWQKINSTYCMSVYHCKNKLMIEIKIDYYKISKLSNHIQSEWFFNWQCYIINFKFNTFITLSTQ